VTFQVETILNWKYRICKKHKDPNIDYKREKNKQTVDLFYDGIANLEVEA
jgi:hypothetical protein